MCTPHEYKENTNGEKKRRIVIWNLKIQKDFLQKNFFFCRLCANKDCSYSKDDVQSVGRVYLFHPNLSTQPMATITGHKTFMKLGTSLSVGKPYNNSEDILAISAATLCNLCSFKKLI